MVKRKIWGTDIYTDDSDIVAILYHTGHLTLLEELKTEKKTKSLKSNRVVIKTGFDELYIDNPQSQALVNIKEENEWKSPGSNDVGAIPDSPSSAKQKRVGSLEAEDCIVTTLIRPCLEKYQGSYRNGIYSRSWLTKHYGVSFSIQKTKFVSEGKAESSFVAKRRRLNSSSPSPEIPVFYEEKPFSSQLEPGHCPEFSDTEETGVDSP